MGLEKYKLIFTRLPYHPKWCAWSRTDRVPSGRAVNIGLSDPDPGCQVTWTPRDLALHELCHVKMMHLWQPGDANSEEKHQEVRECMEAWKSAPPSPARRTSMPAPAGSAVRPKAVSSFLLEPGQSN